MIHSHAHTDSACTLSVEEVPLEDVHRYGVVSPLPGCDLQAGPFQLQGLVEKPDTATAPSRLAIAPRYVFNRSIFDAISATLPGRGGDLWLTDSIAILIRQGFTVRALQLLEQEQSLRHRHVRDLLQGLYRSCRGRRKYGYLIRQYLVSKADQF